MVRVIHHLVDVDRAIGQIVQTLRPAAPFILEYANKRNWKAVARYWTRRQEWNPFDQKPTEFVPLNFDFHPTWMHERLRRAGFLIEQIRTVSHFRIPLLKRTVPTSILAALDGFIQPTGGLWQLSPSVFVKAEAPSYNPIARTDQIFCCPECRQATFVVGQNSLDCGHCGRRWAIRDGIYDFKEPIS